MNPPDFTLSFTVGSTLGEAFEAINNPRGWWSTDLEGMTDRVGKDFVFVDPGVLRTALGSKAGSADGALRGDSTA